MLRCTSFDRPVDDIRGKDRFNVRLDASCLEPLELDRVSANWMKLPHAEQALVPRGKIENYLLDPAHPIGGGKARFFVHFGFRRANNGSCWPKPFRSILSTIPWHIRLRIPTV